MRSLTTVLLPLVALLAACGADAAVAPETTELRFSAQAQPNDRCSNVRGAVLAAFVESSVAHPVLGDPAQIEGETSGDVDSDAYAWVDWLSQDPADPATRGAIQIRMRHLYVDKAKEWMLWTADEGVLAPIGEGLYSFNNRLEVEDGTGVFEGATGMLRSHGTVDFGANVIELEYNGRICTAAN